MIRLVEVRKRFSEHQRWISNGINLDIPDGQMTCMIGQSGEGKSVLLKQIIGLIKPTSGLITIDGVDVTRLTEQEHRELLQKSRICLSICCFIGFAYCI